MGDFLLATEIPDLILAPGSVVRAATRVRLIDDREGWLLAGKLRNIMSHEYSGQRRDEAMELIRSRFLPLMKRLLETMIADRDGS